MPRRGLLLGGSNVKVVYRDNFNRPDSTDLGAPWVETQGDWQVQSNRLYCDTGGANAGAQVQYEADLAQDHYAQVVVLADHAGPIAAPHAPRLSVRYGDTNNYFSGGFEPVQSEWQVFRRVNGSSVKVATAPYVANTVVSGDVLRVESDGNTIRVIHNGTVRLTHSDANLVGNMRAGIRAYLNTVLKFDDWECGEL